MTRVAVIGQDTQFRALLEGSPDAIVMVDAERDRRAPREYVTRQEQLTQLTRSDTI